MQLTGGLLVTKVLGHVYVLRLAHLLPLLLQLCQVALLGGIVGVGDVGLLL